MSFVGWILLIGLSASAALAGPGQPLASFGLTPAALEGFGYRDADRGLLELATARWFEGADRERKLRELASLAAPAAAVTKPLGDKPLGLPSLSLGLPEGELASGLGAWYDGSLSRAANTAPGTAREENDGAPGRGAAPENTVLAQAAGPAARLSPVGRATLAAPRLHPLAPVAVGALQSRGDAAELARMLAGRLPGSPASDLAAAGTQAAWDAVDRLVDRYAGQARLPKPGWELEMATAYREGFARRWGAGAVAVTVTDDVRLFAHRGLWVGNPILRRADRTLELVLNLPWMETIAQDGAFGDARLVRLRQAFGALEGAERNRIIEEALGGRDPQAMSYGLLYRLAGWMQAELLESAGGEPEAARARTLGRVQAHPLWRTIYEGSLNAAVNLTRSLGAGLSHPELGKPDSDGDLWTLVREANAGSGSAAEELAVRLSVRREYFGYAEYLDLSLETNRVAARKLVAAVPKGCGLSGRLAQARDPAGIRGFAANCVGRGAEDFLLEGARRSGSGPLEAGYRAFLEDLIQHPGDRPFAERLESRREWLVGLAEQEPARTAALWDLLPSGARDALVSALGSQDSAPAREALANLLLERPAAAPPAPAAAAVELVLRRARGLSASRLEAAAAAPAKAFHAQPQSFIGLLREPAVVAPLLRGARAGGVDAEFLTAVAFQEGYYVYAKSLAEGIAFGSFTSMNPMGLDSFGDLAASLKRRGLLRPDFNEYVIEGTQLNEADHQVPLARFTGPDAALEAMAALVRHKRAQFQTDAKTLKLDLRGLSSADLELWTYVYYNYRNPKAMLAQNGLGWVRKTVGPDHPLYNAQRVAATAAFLRELGLYRGLLGE